MKQHFSITPQLVFTLFGMALLLPGRAQADTITLSATDSGFYNALGRNAKYDGTLVTIATNNYSVGAIDDGPLGGVDVARKNYFTFDLSSIADTEIIIGAELMLYNPGIVPDGVEGYSSPDPFEIYKLGGTLSPGMMDMDMFAADLAKVHDPFMPGPAMVAKHLYSRLADTLDAFPLLGALGEIEVTSESNGEMLTIPFSDFGVTYLNVFSGGKVVLGGKLTTLDGVPGADEVMFGYTKPLLSEDFDPTPTPMLILTTAPVPAPPALLTAMIGALPGALLLYRRRKA